MTSAADHPSGGVYSDVELADVADLPFHELFGESAFLAAQLRLARETLADERTVLAAFQNFAPQPGPPTMA